MEDTKMQQFFLFIQEEVYNTEKIHVIENGVQFVHYSGKVVTIKQSGSNMIRQVNDSGQERLLFEVKHFKAQSSFSFITIQVELLGGEQLEKQFRLYQQPTWVYLPPLVNHHPLHPPPNQFVSFVICEPNPYDRQLYRTA
ncbi:competence type IV pilus minor pilin ComGF [Pontibacillus chungwhensis]|uniref:Competence type IV pilus minor pilin ComGF n=1 Tax=Pontibacillus chungwhensis TaxID=265426 RepID=A0ABY8UX19_9BACI|nr:competence type IV pilus minor pilin ComGF [Pontibacillus chungwhensis]WIF96924.1 competence type IV pilus minor pilin ComGF [Pontibacillus chungwhensis]